MNLAVDDGMLNLAGVLMFTERPEWIKHQFVVKAIRYPGNEIHVTDYVDTAGFVGPLKKIFDDALEIISPGHLPNNMTVEKILTGNSNIRNPILVSYVAKGLLPYHGLGSGIPRAPDEWPQIDFTDDRDGCLFIATVHRKPVDELILGESSPKSSSKSSPKTELRIIELIRQDPYTTTETIGEILGITKRAVLKQINKLKAQNHLRRLGPSKGGHWEVIE